MMRKGLFIPLLFLSACATTGTDKIISAQTDGRPVEQLSQDGFDLKATLSEADQYLAEGHYKKAFEAYEQVRLRHPKNAAALRGGGQAALNLGDGQRAYERLSRLRDADTIEAEDLAALMLSRVMTDRADNPHAVLRKALTLSPEDARLWNAMGLLADKDERWMDAQDYYVRALQTGKATAGIVNNLGTSLMMQGRYAESFKKFLQACEMAPDNRLYDNNRRMTLLLTGHYRRALKGLPDDRAAALYNDAGYIAMTRARDALAEMLFERALEISPVYMAEADANLTALRARQNTGSAPAAKALP